MYEGESGRAYTWRLPSFGGDLYVARVFGECHSQMHACLCAVHFQHVAKFRPKALDEDFATLAIQIPHSPNMASEVAFLHEFSENFLWEIRREDIHRKAYQRETIREILGMTM
jgi:hypothetical protein